MKFTAEVTALQDALANVVKALPVRSTMPVLEGIYMELKGDKLLLRCSDTMMQKESVIDVEGEDEGVCVIPSKLFYEYVRKLPSEKVELKLLENSVSLKCGKSRSKFQCIEFDNYPAMSVGDGDKFIEAEAAALQKILQRIVPFTGQDESRPALTGAYIEARDNKLTMVATDSFQLSMQSMSLKIPCDEIKTIIPGKTIGELLRMTEKGDGTVRLVFTRTHLRVDMGYSRLVSRLIEGNYIDYKRILPQSAKIRCSAEKEDVYYCMDRLQLVSREGNNSIVMRLGSENISVSARGSNGESNDEIPVQLSGEELEIAFNPKYIMNALKGIDDERIYMEFNSSVNPCKIRGVTNEDSIYLVVPMRLV